MAGDFLLFGIILFVLGKGINALTALLPAHLAEDALCGQCDDENHDQILVHSRFHPLARSPVYAASLIQKLGLYHQPPPILRHGAPVQDIHIPVWRLHLAPAYTLVAIHV
jgi:hypothetical protein